MKYSTPVGPAAMPYPDIQTDDRKNVLGEVHSLSIN
jgi:hypothetical protein